MPMTSQSPALSKSPSPNQPRSCVSCDIRGYLEFPSQPSGPAGDQGDKILCHLRTCCLVTILFCHQMAPLNQIIPANLEAMFEKGLVATDCCGLTYMSVIEQPAIDLTGMFRWWSIEEWGELTINGHDWCSMLFDNITNFGHQVAITKSDQPACSRTTNILSDV